MRFIKSILKKIFPIIFLKKTYAVWKKTNAAIIEPLLFPEYHVPHSGFLVYRKGFPFKENSVKIDSISDDRVRKYMSDWYNWTQEEFLLDFRQPVVIEPSHGWAITRKRKLLYYSLGISRTWFLAKPSLFAFLFRRKVKSVPELISFRDTGEENYFHFFNDVVAKYFFLRANDIDFRNKPVLVSKKLYDKPYFKWYKDQLGDVTWLVQDDEYIETGAAIFCKPLTHRKDLLEKIFRPVIKASTLNKRIYVTRNPDRLRHVENEQEVTQLLQSLNFEVVDAGALSPEQQRETFSNASVMVGVHGAALTNIFFRDKNCSVLEIFPPPEEGYLPFHYIMLASMKGFEYDAVIGEGTKLNSAGGFKVNIQQLEAAIRRML